MSNKDAIEDAVRKAFAGSFMEVIVKALEKNYRPHGPLAIILAQAIMAMSLALTHKKNREDGDLFPEFIPDGSPAHRSRVYINTMDGNVPNAYILVVAPASAGKGIFPASLVKATGYQEINSGSIQGIADSAILNPHILMVNNEFSSVLKMESGSVTKCFLTDAFSHGTLKMPLSRRTKAPQRDLTWFYPSFYTAIQPEMLARCASEDDLRQGLFPRFLIAYVDPEDANYKINPVNRDFQRDCANLSEALSVISSFSAVVEIPVENYPDYLTDYLREEDPKYASVIARYANQYLARVALMLSIPTNPASNTVTCLEITQENLVKASVIMAYFFSMMKRAMATINDLRGAARERENGYTKMLRLLRRLAKGMTGGLVTLSAIAHSSSGSGWDAAGRNALLSELEARGLIQFVRDGDVVPDLGYGCKIRLVGDEDMA